jgi:hypothetical protein
MGAEAVPASFLARSAEATAMIAIARISRSDPTNSIGARDVIEDVEDRINGLRPRFGSRSPFRTRNAELDKLANRQNGEVAMAAIASPHRCHKRNAVTTRAWMPGPPQSISKTGVSQEMASMPGRFKACAILA